jgi:ABC-type uncharacterized transport system ATPase subunit
MKTPLVELRGVGKRFGACVAVDGADVALHAGQLAAIVGENGAGKSTLLKLAAGTFAPSEGSVLIDGKPLAPASAAEAMRRGVGLVYQHFQLVGAFTALENLVLGSEPVTTFGVLDRRAAETRARELMKSAGLSVRLDALADELTVGERQRLEILRVLYRGARAVLLDEPTAVLAPVEADELYALLRRLADGGSAIAVVTHRLDEVVRYADHVTVMRRGRVVLSRGKDADPFAEDELTRAVMGDATTTEFSRPALADDAAAVLEVRGLSVAAGAGLPPLDDVSFTVRSSEIVGIAGVEGNGQRELVRALAGLEPDARGEVIVGGQTISQKSARDRRAHLGVVHEDRHVDGLVLDASVGDNLILGDLGDPRATPLREAEVVAERIRAFELRPAEPTRLASELSGGNQQKLVVARALYRVRHAGDHAALVLAQPTRGVDIGAASAIHAAITEAAREGLAVLVVSADLAELRKLCHRLLVMHRGRVVAELPSDSSDEALGRAMLGLGAT